MTNTFDFRPGDVVFEFESPIEIKSAFKWFSKNIFDKHRVSYEFAAFDPKDIPIIKEEERGKGQHFKDTDELFNVCDKEDIKYAYAVAIYHFDPNKLNLLKGLIKNKYKVKTAYVVFAPNMVGVLK